MKNVYRLLFAFTLVLISLTVRPQGSTVIIFSEKGERFNVEFNGSMQSQQPVPRIEIDNIFGPSFKFKVYMEGAESAPISKMVFNKINGSFFFVIKKDSKGKYVLETTGHDWSDKVEQQTQAQEAGHGETAANAAATSATSDQTAATGAPKEKGAPAGQGTEKRWCETPVSDADFIAGYTYISNVSFDPTRMAAAKGFAGDHCLLSAQVKEIVELFSMESARLDFAKFAYTHTYDPANYSVVNDAFHSKSSAESLKKYIDSKNK
jgi:hypothetical protein